VPSRQFSCSKANEEGILTKNSCKGLTAAHNKTRGAKQGAIFLTSRVAEQQQQKEGSAPLPAYTSPTAHQ